jgi:hypothetical protein
MIDNEGGTREEQEVPVSYLELIIKPTVILVIANKKPSAIKTILIIVPQLMVLLCHNSCQ